MQTYEVKLPPGSEYFIYHTFVVTKTTANIIIIPCIIIEVRAISLCKAVQIDYFTLLIFQVASLYT